MYSRITMMIVYFVSLVFVLIKYNRIKLILTNRKINLNQIPNMGDSVGVNHENLGLNN